MEQNLKETCTIHTEQKSTNPSMSSVGMSPGLILGGARPSAKYFYVLPPWFPLNRMCGSGKASSSITVKLFSEGHLKGEREDLLLLSTSNAPLVTLSLQHLGMENSIFRASAIE